MDHPRTDATDTGGAGAADGGPDRTAEGGTLLTTQVTDHEGYALVAIAGELDMATAPDLFDVLAEAIGSGDTDIVLDLSGLEFCDSAGLAVFVRARNQLDQSGHRLIVAAPTEAVARILDLSGVSQVVPTVTDTAAARAMVGGSSDDGAGPASS